MKSWASLHAASVVLLLAASPAVAEPDLKLLLAQAKQVQARDLADWGRMAFQRTVTREKLDATGKVKTREVLHFNVTSQAEGGFDELLFRIDERTPKPKEIDSHRKAKRFSERYEVAISGDSPNYEQDQFSLTGLLARDGYVYEGVEEKNGHTCHRLSFDARPDGPDAKVEDRMWNATAGRLWLEKEDLHIVRSETWMARPVSAYALAKVRNVQITVQGDRHGQFWLPSSIEVRSDLSVAGSAMRKRNLFEYAEFRPVFTDE